jgi:hypothetical protein
MLRHRGVDLDRGDVARDRGERSRQSSYPRTDLDDVIARRDRSVADDLICDATVEEVSVRSTAPLP